jgi:phosphomannomutase/phosphoglucomutase
MIKKTIFREYDIRGIYPDELNEQTVKLLGYYFGCEVNKRNKTKGIVSIGYDARTHSPTLFKYLSCGLNEAGCNVLSMGMVATGINYFANHFEFNWEKPNASIMITGSHNPKEYNGFKMTIDNKPFFANDIYSLGDEIIKNQNRKIANDDKFKSINAKSLYINWMSKEFAHLKGMKDKFIIDCGNGVADTALTQILDNLNLNYDGIYCEPDGTFPNHHPDPSEEENLKDVKEYLKKDYEYAFAYDGDADRIAFLTKKNNVKGDILALLFAKTMDKPTVVGEVKCSQIMYDLINENGGNAVMYKTGHSNLKVKIKEINADFGAEVSGHLFFNDRYFGFDDAIYATFRILELIHNKMDIDKEISKLPKIYNTDEIKTKVSEDNKFQIIKEIKNLLENPPNNFPKIKDIIEIDGLRIVFENGWALIRASNTTPVLVSRFEAISEEELHLYENKVNELIEQVVD